MRSSAGASDGVVVVGRRGVVPAAHLGPRRAPAAPRPAAAAVRRHRRDERQPEPAGVDRADRSRRELELIGDVVAASSSWTKPPTIRVTSSPPAATAAHRGHDPADRPPRDEHDPPAGEQRPAPSAPASGKLRRLPTLRRPRTAHRAARGRPSGTCNIGWWPANAARPLAAMPTRTTGPNVRALGSGRHPSSPSSKQVRVPGVARRALLVDLDQEGVAVAVHPDLLHVLPVAGGLALDPVLLPRAAPVRRPPGAEAAVQRLVVHPRQHQHLAGVVLLDDRGHQAGVVAREPGGDGGIEGGHPAHYPGWRVSPAAPSRTRAGRRRPNRPHGPARRGVRAARSARGRRPRPRPRPRPWTSGARW